MSIDGVGAYDLTSRNATKEGLLRMEDGDQVLQFVRSFYGSPSTYLWDDEVGNPQDIPQGGERRTGRPPRATAVRTGFSSSVERCSSKAE